MPALTRAALAASRRSWIAGDLEPPGPPWLQWLWTLLFAAAVALVFTLVGMAVGTGARPGIWLDPAVWARWYRVNFVISLTVAVLIHALFVAAIATLGRARIRRWSNGRQALFFTTIPIAGVVLGWPLGVWLVSEAGLGWVRLSAGALGTSVAIAVVVSLGIYLTFDARARQALAEKRAAEAQLRLLQAQMEPHFLFNTLANVKRLYETTPERGRDMLSRLIAYLRAALPGMRRSVSTLGHELELVRSYLAILQMRMGERLRFGIDAERTLLAARLPPMVLPTLVENAIKHGLAPLPEGGRINLRARRDGDSLVVEVADDGRGFVGSSGSGVGLANTRARLAALFGDRAALELEAAVPRGVIARLRLPLREALAPHGAGVGAAASATAGVPA